MSIEYLELDSAHLNNHGGKLGTGEDGVAHDQLVAGEADPAPL